MEGFFDNLLYRCLFLLVVKYNLLDKNTVSHAEDLNETNVCIILILRVSCVEVIQDFSFSVNCLNTSCNCPTNKFEYEECIIKVDFKPFLSVVSCFFFNKNVYIWIEVNQALDYGTIVVLAVALSVKRLSSP